MTGSDYLLLRQTWACPVCKARRDNVTGFCHNCGLKLFSSVDYDFAKFEQETNIRNWWAWDNERGFVHRDFFMVKDANPNHRVLKLDPLALDKNYGRHCTPAQAAAAFRKKANRVRHRRTK